MFVVRSTDTVVLEAEVVFKLPCSTRVTTAFQSEMTLFGVVEDRQETLIGWKELATSMEAYPISPPPCGNHTNSELHATAGVTVANDSGHERTTPSYNAVT
jgi:hypothetical protein